MTDDLRPVLPGRFYFTPDELPIGALAKFRRDEEFQFAMKVRNDRSERDHLLRFYPRSAKREKPNLLLSESLGAISGPTLLALENLEIAPGLALNFSGPLETANARIGPGGLGLSAEGTPFLSFTISGESEVVGAVDLNTALLRTPSSQTAWFPAWRITVAGAPPDHPPIFEMDG
jgi:hypothetical protein